MIEINKSQTADTRTCDFANTGKAALLASSRQHISDVVRALAFFSGKLIQAAGRQKINRVPECGLHQLVASRGWSFGLLYDNLRPQLYRQTADVLERLEKGEKVALQGKTTHWNDWLDATRADAWVFLRERRRYSHQTAPHGRRLFPRTRIFAITNIAKFDLERLPFRVRLLPFRLQRKPAPVIVPWSFEDQLCGMVLVGKVGKSRAVIIAQGGDSVRLGGCWWIYRQLLESWQQLDGKPCGKEQG
jgi:hypothetical protein